MEILLASQSPRRRELLQQLGFDFQVVSIDCEETFSSDLPMEEVAGFLSLKKANAFSDLKENQILITADTIVTFQNEILGKPKSTEDAQQMLRKLSGATHEVYTGITIKTTKNTITKTDKAEVTFSNISEEEIDFYIQHCNPMDKAGSYGIQDWLGMAMIEKISGSYYTIMGLPTHILYQELNKILS